MDVAFAEHTNVERVAIAGDALQAGFFCAVCPCFVSAVCLRNKAVKRGTIVAELLWSINFQQTTVFIQFVLDRIKRCDFYVCVDEGRKLIAFADAVPWMRCFQGLRVSENK